MDEQVDGWVDGWVVDGWMKEQLFLNLSLNETIRERERFH